MRLTGRHVVLAVAFLGLAGCANPSTHNPVGPVPKSHHIGWEHLGPVFPAEDVGNWQSPTFYQPGGGQ